MSMKRMTACARGRVQGVGYRYFVTGCARETGVLGYVRNMEDGSVEVVAEGSETVLQEFVRQLLAPGDPAISIDDFQVAWSEPTGEFSGFRIRW